MQDNRTQEPTNNSPTPSAYYNGKLWPEAVRKDFVEYVKGGGGFVVVYRSDVKGPITAVTGIDPLTASVELDVLGRRVRTN